MYVLILTLFSMTSQTGASVEMHDFNSKSACEAAASVWLGSIPRSENKKYYDIGNAPRALCVPKE